MQEPVACLHSAEEPVAVAGGIEGVEIIAGFPVAGPPLAGDTLGAQNINEAMNFAVSGERDGMTLATFGRSDDDADGLGDGEKAKGAMQCGRIEMSILRGGEMLKIKMMSRYAHPAWQSRLVFGKIPLNSEAIACSIAAFSFPSPGTPGEG